MIDEIFFDYKEKKLKYVESKEEYLGDRIDYDRFTAGRLAEYFTRVGHDECVREVENDLEIIIDAHGEERGADAYEVITTTHSFIDDKILPRNDSAEIQKVVLFYKKKKN